MRATLTQQCRIGPLSALPCEPRDSAQSPRLMPDDCGPTAGGGAGDG